MNDTNNEVAAIPELSEIELFIQQEAEIVNVDINVSLNVDLF